MTRIDLAILIGPVCLALVSCNPVVKPGGVGQAGLIEVGPDGFGFRDANTHAPFVPVGVNYDHDAKGRLIEEYWDDEWMRVAGDFVKVAGLGFNVIRVHLQFNRFMTGPAAVNEHAFSRLGKLLDMARGLQLHVLLTGLAHYRKDDIPGWFISLDDEGRAAAEASFWREVARRFHDEPAVFCYDLQNEPIISPADTREIVGPPFHGVEGTYHFINIHRLPRMPDGTGDGVVHVLAGERAVAWTALMVAAIRESDRRHMITIGSLPGALPFYDSHYTPFSPQNLGDLLDFVSVHLHLDDGPDNDAVAAEMVLRASFVGKPVVIEELSMLVPRDVQDRFLARARGGASGYLGYFWGDTPGVLRAKGTMRDAITADQIERLTALAKEIRADPPVRRRGDVVFGASIADLRLSKEKRARLRVMFEAAITEGKFVDFALTP